MAKDRAYENARLAKILGKAQDEEGSVSQAAVQGYLKGIPKTEKITKSNTLLNISQKYGVPASAIEKANPNTSFSTGVQLRIPNIQGDLGRPVVQKTFYKDWTPQQKFDLWKEAGQRSAAEPKAPFSFRNPFAQERGRASVQQQAAAMNANSRLSAAPNTTYNPNAQVDNRTFWQKARDALTGQGGFNQAPSGLMGVQGSAQPQVGTNKMAALAQSAISPFARNGVVGNAGGVGNKVMQHTPITRQEIIQNNLQGLRGAFTPQSVAGFFDTLRRPVMGTPQGAGSPQQQALLQQQQGVAKGLRSPAQSAIDTASGIRVQGGAGGVQMGGVPRPGLLGLSQQSQPAQPQALSGFVGPRPTQPQPVGQQPAQGAAGFLGTGTQSPPLTAPRPPSAAPTPQGTSQSLLATSGTYNPASAIESYFSFDSEGNAVIGAQGRLPADLPQEVFEQMTPDQKDALNDLYQRDPKTNDLVLTDEAKQRLAEAGMTVGGQGGGQGGGSVTIGKVTYQTTPEGRLIRPDGSIETAQDFYKRTGNSTYSSRWWMRGGRSGEEPTLNPEQMTVEQMIAAGMNPATAASAGSSTWRI